MYSKFLMKIENNVTLYNIHEVGLAIQNMYM